MGAGAGSIPIILIGLLAVLAYRVVDFERLPLPCLTKIEDVPREKWKVPAELEGPFAPNAELRKAKRLFAGQIKGSESVAFTKSGREVYMIDRDGYLHVARGDSRDPSSLEVDPSFKVYLGPGRPLGFHLDTDDNLLTCSLLGLTKLAKGSKTQIQLANSVVEDGELVPINYADDLDLTPDGDVIFSDASHIPPSITRTGRYDSMHSYMLDVFAGARHGKLLRWRPSTGDTDVLASGLWFPNGVATAADGSYVVFAETTTARILKHWLKGPKAGETEILIMSLPGYPDGVSRAPDDNFWVPIVTKHVPVLDWAVRSKLARWALAWLSEVVDVPISHVGMVVKFSGDGKVLKFLMDEDASTIGAITSAVEHDGHLYLGSLANPFVGVLDLSQV